MQTPVRYYITRDDDRPVVRSIPVSVRPEPKKLDDQKPAETVDTFTAVNVAAPRRRVKTLMQSAVRRQPREK